MNLEEAKKHCKNFVDENKDRPIILHEAIETVLSELDKKDKIIKRVCKECNDEEVKNAQLQKDNLTYEEENTELEVENRILNQIINEMAECIAQNTVLNKLKGRSIEDRKEIVIQDFTKKVEGEII